MKIFCRLQSHANSDRPSQLLQNTSNFRNISQRYILIIMVVLKEKIMTVRKCCIRTTKHFHHSQPQHTSSGITNYVLVSCLLTMVQLFFHACTTFICRSHNLSF